jgi:hypothetical protein
MAAQGLGESWGVQRRLREGAKERLRLRRSWGGLGVWVTHATDAVHPAGSLRLAQIGARGGFLEGSRRGKADVLARTGCGAGERAQVQRSGCGGSGQRSRDGAGRKGTILTCGVIGSARAERRGRGAGLGRGKRSA